MCLWWAVAEQRVIRKDDDDDLDLDLDCVVYRYDSNWTRPTPVAQSSRRLQSIAQQI
jgi:hypothetical protein